MDQVNEQLLAQMVEVIVREVDPRQVYLFGSCARGEMGPDSDVDLLIIEDEPFGGKRSRFREIRRIRDVLYRFRVPKDILVYSWDEVEHWGRTLNHIIADCLREGRLLYERH
jgi:predicted nucleotidyltransferase